MRCSATPPRCASATTRRYVGRRVGRQRRTGNCSINKGSLLNILFTTKAREMRGAAGGATQRGAQPRAAQRRAAGETFTADCCGSSNPKPKLLWDFTPVGGNGSGEI
jgi:hypothetical protein